ncbi:hypothetical protein J7T55_011018 [Diaporthe amygdali]|uniref:uncharacterized protein n=1 Tax=Phomopsis amygdali TaxID=1214568 RepID=UPI0022FE1EE9|nr:uncharacterized protein J7T55_011018 [Diaporthe amygdali]KAJ0106923.1 hypothetical protein J7T55_011018 [Diaporthe amygdali]
MHSLKDSKKVHYCADDPPTWSSSFAASDSTHMQQDSLLHVQIVTHLDLCEMKIERSVSTVVSEVKSTANSSPGPSLHEAAKNGDVRSLRKLLRPGSAADVNELDDEDRSALHYASNSLIAEKLINAGSEIDVEDAEGYTPLHRAVAERRIDVVWLLLVHDAKTDIRDDDGKTPMGHAKGCPAAEWMLRHGPSNSLLRAVEANRADVVEALINAGADKEVRDENDFVALIVATLRGSWDAARVLIEQGVDLDVYGDMGNGVLHMAAHRAPAEFMGYLLDKGLPINYQNHWGGTPLLEAAERDNRDETIALLLERGADPEPRNNAGYTPLQLAARSGKMNVVKMILSRMRERELLGPSYPSKPGAGSWYPLAEASYHTHPECVRLLLAAGSELNIRNDERNTPLHLVVWPTNEHREVDDQTEILHLLLDHGASIDAKGHDEMTPLALACRWNSLPLVQMLIDAGAELDSISWHGRGADREFGYTSLMLSVAFGGDDNLDVVTALVNAGADVNARTHRKKLNALEMAQSRGRMDLASVLEDAGSICDKPRNTSIGRGRR